MEVRHRCSCGPPRGVEPRLSGSLDTVEVDAPSHSRVKVFRQTLHGQGQLCLPSFSLLIKIDAAPQSTLQIVFLSRRNIQINPEAIGAHLKLFIASGLRPSRLQKHFNDIAVPELVSPPTWFGIEENRDAAIARQKSQIESVLSPKQPNLCLKFWVGVLALPVVIEVYRRSAFPRLIRGKSFRIGAAGELHRRDSRRFASR